MTDLYPTPLSAALMYAVMGWQVVPVRPGSKVPSIADWVNAASTDEATIRAWWEAQPDAGVAIVTGKTSGLFVLDVDVSNGKPGMETLKQLIADNGGEQLPETLVARTPSGGYHYVFAYPDDAEIHNSASNRLGPGLDIRGQGGQINASPTQRGDAAYRWADGRAPWSAVVQLAPAWLLDLVKDQEPKPAMPVRRVHTPEAALAIRTEYDREKAPYATRFNAEHSWPELLTAAGWTHCSTTGDVDYWARPGKSCRDGHSASTNYGDSDVLYNWSGNVGYLPLERAFDKYGFMARQTTGNMDPDWHAVADPFIDAYRADRAKGEVLLPASENPDSETVSENPAGPESKFSQALMPLWSADFWTNDPTAKDWLVEPFLANGRAHALYASAKAGKSYVALQAIAAACVPGHESWAATPTELIRVLYLDYEMTEDDLRERLTIFGYDASDDYSRLHYVKASMLGADLDTKDGGRELADQAIAWGVQLVVVDTMSRAVSGDENDADTVRKFYQHTGRLLKAHGIAWLRIDHAGKDGEKGQRGSSAKNDDVDVVWRLERLDAGAKLTTTHSRVFWIDGDILLRNVAKAGGGVTHVRTDSIDAVVGLNAKAAEWVRRGIPLDVSKRDLREEYGVEFRDADFSKLKARATEIHHFEALVPGGGSRGSDVGTAEPRRETGVVPSQAPPIGGLGNRPVASTVPAELTRLQQAFGITDQEDA